MCPCCLHFRHILTFFPTTSTGASAQLREKRGREKSGGAMVGCANKQNFRRGRQKKETQKGRPRDSRGNGAPRGNTDCDWLERVREPQNGGQRRPDTVTDTALVVSRHLWPLNERQEKKKEKKGKETRPATCGSRIACGKKSRDKRRSDSREGPAKSRKHGKEP